MLLSPRFCLLDKLMIINIWIDGLRQIQGEVFAFRSTRRNGEVSRRMAADAWRLVYHYNYPSGALPYQEKDARKVLINN